MKNSKIIFKPALLAGIITFSTLPAMHLSEFTFPPQWFAASFNEPSAQNSSIVKRFNPKSNPDINLVAIVCDLARKQAKLYLDQIKKTPTILPENKSDLYALISPIIKTLGNNGAVIISDVLITSYIRNNILMRFMDEKYTQQQNDEFLLKWANLEFLLHRAHLEFLLQIAQPCKPKL